MSDIEVPDVPGDDMDGEMSDGSTGGGHAPLAELPEGVQKEVLKEGDGYKKPKAGDEVTVHYVGSLAADGSEFDSSRGREAPFNFTLGQGSVIKGWDLGVATMRKGELAKFTLAPEFAYGEAGSPPKIPASATLVFEVELLGWVAKDDLFQDGGVVKTLLKEGTGWRKPSDGDDVRISLRCTAKDGSVLEERSAWDYALGSEALGQLGKAVDRALTGMKKGEEAELVCNPAYALGERTPDGARVALTLEHMYETADVSFAKDRSLMKKQIVDGETYDKPKDAARATLRVESATSAAGEPLEGFAARSLEFTVGNGEVCDALECAVCEMKRGEKAVLTCTKPELCADERLGLKSISAGAVVLTLELVSYEKAPEAWDMSEEEKLEHCASRKEVGSALFRSGRAALAMGRYKRVLDVAGYVDDFKEQARKDRAREMKRACQLNVAACQIKLKDYAEASKTCDKILSEDSLSVKARFRRAQAQLGMKNFLDCMADLRKVLERDSQSREARALLREAQAGQREEDRQSKGLFAKMCSGLGKRPVPTPSRPDARPAAPEPGERKRPRRHAAEGEGEGEAEDAPADAEVGAPGAPAPAA